MPEEAPRVGPAHRTLAILILVGYCAGALFFTIIGFLDLFEEDRLGGVGYLSAAMGIFLFGSWVRRILVNPRPT